MKTVILLMLAFPLAGSASFLMTGNAWEFDYARTCTFSVEGDTAKVENCDQFYRSSFHLDEEGKKFTVFHYKWIGENGREVVYHPKVGSLGVGIFTIGVLYDNRYRGNSSFEPAVSHTLHRGSIVIGVPNDNYLFTVEDTQD